MTYSVKLPSGIVLINIPDGTTQDQILEKLGAETVYGNTKPQEPANTSDASVLGEAGKAIGRGLKSSGALIVEGLPAVFKAAMGEITGEDWGGKEQTEKLVQTLDRINNDPKLKAAVGSYEDVQTPHDAALYLANAAQFLPDLAGSLGAGALVKYGTKKAAIGLGKKALLNEAGDALTKKAATAAFTTGVAGYNQAVMTPSEQASIYAETGEVAPGIATGSAAIQNVGETLSDMFLGGKLGKEVVGRGLKSMLKAGGEGLVTEALTEGAQALVSEGAQELANPEKATFNLPGVIDQTILGGAGGFGVKAALQPFTGVSAPKTTSNFKPEEEVKENPSQEAPIAPAPVQIQQEPPAEAVTSPVGMDEAPTPPPEAYEQDIISRKPGRPKGKVNQIADDIRTEMKATEAAKLQSVPEQPKSKFNLYSNAVDEEGMKYRGFIKESLDKVGFDEDVVFLDPKDNSDETWFGLDKVAPGIGKFRDEFQKLITDPLNQGAAVQFKADDGTMKHLFYVNRDAIKGKPEQMRTFLHEGLGHTIVNRFMMRDPTVRDGFVSLVKDKLNAAGLDTEGLSYNDINKVASSWSLDENGALKPTKAGADDEKVKFTPIRYGANTDPALSKNTKDLQYRSAADEVLTEQVARWMQSNETPLTVMDKFFKNIADMYRKFIETARSMGLLPWREVEDFMNDLVLKARGASVAAAYTDNPGGGLQELRAYHGSPHKFEKFTTDRIGTGEGYQAFGWGLYFTNSKAIADFYKKKLSGNNNYAIFNKQGERVDWDELIDFAEQNNIVENSTQRSRFLDAFDALAIKGYDEAINQYKESLQGMRDVGGNPSAEKRVQEIVDYLHLLHNQGFTKAVNKPGAVYSVDIPEESEMLEWDEPISQEILDKLPEEMKNFVKPKMGWTGSVLYESLIDSEGSDKAASEFLNSLGIKGIKYKAGQMSGMSSNATNYVIFDDAAIQINQVYDNDSLVSQLRSQEQNEQADQNPDKQSPFVGYRPNPKVENLVNTPYNGLNSRVNAIVNAFRNNINKPSMASRSNAVQQYLVLNDALTEGGLDSTYLPDVFRGMIKNTKAVPDDIRNVLNNNVYLTKMAEALRNYYKITKADMRKRGVVEVQAEAYKLYNMRNRLKDIGGDEFKKLDSFVSALPPMVTKSFDFMDALKRQIKSDLNTKAAILTPKDLVQGLTNDTLPSLESLFNEVNDIRDQAKKETLEDRGLGEAFATDPVYNLGAKENTVGGGWLGKWTLLPRFVARYSPAFAAVKAAADSRREAITGFRHLLFEGARDFFMLPDDQADYLGNILDQQRMLGKKAFVNPDTGFLEFQRRKDDGKTETVVLKNPELARIYDQMQKVFATIPLIHRNQLTRSFTSLFAKANLGFEPTKEQFERYKQSVKDGNVAKENRLTPAQMDEMDNYFGTLESIENMMKKDYIPHIRFGTRGAVIKDDKGKTIWFGTFKVDNNGKKDAESYQEFLDEYNAFDAPNKPKVPQEFDLSLDNITRQLGTNNKAMTLELLSQLMNSSNSKLFTEAMKEKLSPEDLVKGRISNRGFMNHFSEADKENIQGYSKDWKRVMSAYFNSAAYFLGNMENEPKILVANSRLQNQNNVAKNLKDYSNKYVESILDPEENFAALREIQYLYAMGLNPSSALLQLQSLFTYMPAVLNLATNSNFKSIANLTKAAKVVPLFFDKSISSKAKTHESLFAFGDADKHEELIKKGKITRQQSDIIKSLYNKGSLQALRSGDMIGVPSDVSTRGNKGKWAQRRNDFVAGAGIMMRTAEEYTRGVQALGAILSLDSPDNVMRLHNNLMKNDALYRTKINESFSKEPDRHDLAQFLVDKALGEYGKEARSPLQNTAASVTLIPFSTYPVQMLLNTYEFIGGKYGKEGKKAALWALASTAATGGLKAIPAALFIKELVEFAILKILGEDRDLEEELKKWASGKSPDWTTRILTNGLFSEALGVDVSSRMAVDVPFATEFLKYLQDEQPMGVSDMLGVQGSLVATPLKVADMAAQGASLEEILSANIPNVAIQNALKSKKNMDGVSYRGLPSLTQEEGSKPLNIAKRVLGFKPIEQGKNERRIDELKRTETRYDVALDRYRKPLAASFKKELLAKDEKEREAAANERARLISELAEFMRSKNLPNIGQSIRATITKAQMEAYGQMQGLTGAAVRKSLKNTARRDFEEIYDANY